MTQIPFSTQPVKLTLGVQIDELVDEYRKKTDEELLRLARDREQLTPEAISALTDELARRKIAAQRFKAFDKEEERYGCKETFRLKRQRARTAGRWWPRIQLVAAYAIGFLVYHLLPFKIPREWEDAAVVTFLCTVAIGFMFQEFWKRFTFWVSLAIAAFAQLWVIKALNPSANWHYKNASILIGFAVGLLVWGAMFLVLRRVSQDSDTRSDFRHESQREP